MPLAASFRPRGVKARLAMVGRSLGSLSIGAPPLGKSTERGRLLGLGLSVIAVDLSFDLLAIGRERLSPRLRQVALQNMPGVTLEGAAVFPLQVHVDYAP